MSVIQLIVAGCALTIASLLLRHFSRKAEGRRVQRFVDRPELSVPELIATYFSGSNLAPAVVEKALRAIEGATTVPCGRLRPGDSFRGELAPERGWEFDDGLQELTWLLKSVGIEDSADVRTVGDFVRRYGCALQKQKHQPQA